MFKNKIILVTGATGTVGRVLVQSLAKTDAKKIICISKTEQNQENFMAEILPELMKKLEFGLVDITNAIDVENAIKNVDYVVHCAAIANGYNLRDQALTKNVNVNGTRNIVNSCIKNKAQRLLFISTSMACNPVNFYGETKREAEEIVLGSVGKLNSSVLRFGNVCSTPNGVVRYFLKKVEDGEENLPITDPEMTRFWVDDYMIAKSVKFCLKNAVGGEIFAYKSPSFKIVDLAKAITDKPYKIVGKRVNEKLIDEILDYKNPIYTNGEMFVEWHNPVDYSKINTSFYRTKEFYTSLNNKFLSIEEIRKILNRG